MKINTLFFVLRYLNALQQVLDMGAYVETSLNTAGHIDWQRDAVQRNAWESLGKGMLINLVGQVHVSRNF